ncbi:MAG TPA: Ig-like domain-containing protein [Anaerolineae bacterium]|nr:Ig-like domain-containing protein [Anaerolineae bacterium]
MKNNGTFLKMILVIVTLLLLPMAVWAEEPVREQIVINKTSKSAIFLPPVNDDLANATIINSLPYTDATINNSTATLETSEARPSCAHGGTNKTVWWQYTPASNSIILINTEGSSFDTVLSVWTGTSHPLNEQGCDDDRGTGYLSSILMPVTGGVTYYIGVTGFLDSDFGNVTLNLFPSAVNDNLANAIIINSTPYTHATINNFIAGMEISEVTPSCGSASEKSVWWQYTPASDGVLVVDTNGSNFDTALSIWTGVNHPLTQQRCDDDGGNSTQSLISMPATAGTTYHIRVAGYNTLYGNITVNVNFSSSPLATDGAYTTNENISTNGNIVTEDTGWGVDTDADSVDLTATVDTNVLNGSLLLNFDGTFIYTPTANFYGTDWFTYRLSDGVLMDTALITITTIPVVATPYATATLGMTATNDIDLAWRDDTSNCSYEVYQSDSPYFVMDVGTLVATWGAGIDTDTINGVTGDTTTNYYFIIKAIGCAADEAISNQVAEFDYGLVVGSPVVAIDDDVEMWQDSSLAIPVLDNDINLIGVELEVIDVYSVTVGVASISGTTHILYTPPISYTGEVTFTYTMSGGGYISNADVMVTIYATPLTAKQEAGSLGNSNIFFKRSLLLPLKKN